MAKGTEEPGREELLAENRARRARLRAEEEEKAARSAGDVDQSDPVDEDDSGDRESGDVPEDSGDASPELGSRTGSRRLVAVLIGLVAVLAIAVGVLGYLLATANSDAGDDGDSRAIDDAKSYAATVLTYSSGDYADLDKRIRAISTPEFADRYIKSSQQARQGNDEAQAKGEAEAKEAGLISRTEAEAVVLVAVDQKVTSPLVPSAGPDGMNYESRIKITLSRDGDAWKLSDLEVV